MCLSQSFDWPLSQLNGLSQRCNSWKALNDCENLKRPCGAVATAVVLCAGFPSALPLPACRNPPNTKNKKFKGGHVSARNSSFPRQKDEDTRVPWSQAGVGSPFNQFSRGIPLRVKLQKLALYKPVFAGAKSQFSPSQPLPKRHQ